MNKKKPEELPVAYVINEDFSFKTDLSKELDIYPCVPTDDKEFKEDVETAMKRLTEDGRPFVEETKMRFIEKIRRY